MIRRNWWGDDHQNPEGNFVAPALGAESYKEQHGTHIGFDPMDWSIVKGGDPVRNPIIGLVHEMLAHSYYQDLGKLFPNGVNSAHGISMNEIVAVDIENHMRRMLRMDDRTKYAGTPIEDWEGDENLKPFKAFPKLMWIQPLPPTSILNKYIQNK